MRNLLKSFAIAGFTTLIILSHGAQATAQDRRGASRDSDQFLKTAGLKIGDALPEAAGYDINGKPFALRDIKGSYAVIVCGCMT